MARHPRTSASPTGYLGIEAGGTRTTARWESDDASESREHVGDAANLQLISDDVLLQRLNEIRSKLPQPRALAIGMAGARTDADRQRIRAAAARVWPGRPCHATHDLDLAMAAAPAPGRSAFAADVLVVSGTGSCCYGKSAPDRTVKVGGWGHWLGDEGSGFDLSLRALRGVVQALDRQQQWGKLAQQILARLHLNHPDALIPWINQASKTDIAALAPVVLECATEDAIARRVVRDAAQDLAQAAAACAKRLAGSRGRVRFLMAGSVLLHGNRFAKEWSRSVRALRAASTMVRIERSGAQGAVQLARATEAATARNASTHTAGEEVSTTEPAPRSAPRNQPQPRRFIPESSELSPTEQRNLRSMNLDQLDAANAIELMLSEDERIPGALQQEKPRLARLLRLTVDAFHAGGRLFYVGAGTSGRLGVLDASECPPTFRTPPELVQGIIAGGEPAIVRSVEGAEDDDEAGAAAIRFRGAGRRDFVLGIAASGRTPFVWGALAEARRRGAKTGLLCFNPYLRIPREHRPDVVLAPRIGPEVLTGSTRLKAGTATKLVLNLLTTLAMVQMGKVARNLMIDVNPANEKLRGRAVRIVRELTGVEESAAWAALERERWIVQKALRRLGWRP